MITRKIDYHVHSDYSYDGEQSIESLCIDMIQKGVEEICLTEHVDIGHPDIECQGLPDWNHWEQDIEKISTKYPGILIRKGIEVGDNPQYREKIKNYITSRAFDYVLLSLHLVDNKDPYNKEQFFSDITREKCYKSYLLSICDELNNYENYDALAHIGYISRYAPWEDKIITYDEFHDIIDEILLFLIKKDKCLEINTKGPMKGQYCPDKSIVKRYIELGGKLFIFGSDAHRNTENYSMIEEAKREVKEMGGKIQVLFRDRKMYTYAL